MTDLVAGLVLGLASSGHCAAMCGPLMVAWRQQAPGAPNVRTLALYHASRIAVYAAFGAVAGVAGRVLSSGGFARGVSIASGLILVLMAASRGGHWAPRWSGIGLGQTLGRGLVLVRELTERHPAVAALAAGALNALLPCGLLYAALVASIAVAEPSRAALTMIMYGVGTTPALAAIWWQAGSIARLGRGRLALVPPLVLAITGGLLIGRGLTTPGVHSDQGHPVPVAEHRH